MYYLLAFLFNCVFTIFTFNCRAREVYNKKLARMMTATTTTTAITNGYFIIFFQKYIFETIFILILFNLPFAIWNGIALVPIFSKSNRHIILFIHLNEWRKKTSNTTEYMNETNAFIYAVCCYTFLSFSSIFSVHKKFYFMIVKCCAL